MALGTFSGLSPALPPSGRGGSLAVLAEERLCELSGVGRKNVAQGLATFGEFSRELRP